MSSPILKSEEVDLLSHNIVNRNLVYDLPPDVR
jgi:hypothetical protein